MKKLFLFITITIVAVSCRKTNSPNNTIVGKWTMSRQSFVVSSSSIPFAYAPLLGATSVEDDGLLSIEFDVNGSYTMSRPFILSTNNYIPGNVITYSTNGNYTIFQDSFLIIQSDTALLKSAYNYTANAPFPKGDTIYFKTVPSDSLYFLQTWTGTYQIQPDSSITAYYTYLSDFKRIK
jgi:hypothetical protein